MVQKADYIWRDSETEYVPSSGVHEPDKAEIREWGTWVEGSIQGAAAGRVDAVTWADLSAIDGTREGQPGRVVGPDTGTHTDPVVGGTVDNEGEYIWSVSPQGWRRTGHLPAELIRATNTNSGDPNAITADTSAALPRTDWSALIALDILETNTQDGPTVVFNDDGTKYTITDAVGTPVSISGLTAGMLLNGYTVGTTFRADMGPRGWSPLIRSVKDGEREVLELYDWTGGHGAKPTETGYIGPNGLTQNIADATDFRGPQGPNGPGTGDMLKSVYDPQFVEADVFDGANIHDHTITDEKLAATSLAYIRPRQELWVTDPVFGGAGTGNDDHDAIEEAIGEAVDGGIGTVYFPPTKDKYNLGSTVVTNTQQGGTSLKGFGASPNGTVINTGFDGPMFDFASTLLEIEGIRFNGDKGTYPNCRAFIAAKTVNTDDLDIKVRRCHFGSFGIPSRIVGRGLYLIENTFAICDGDVELEWPTSGVEGDGVHVLPYGFRKWLIYGNHSHSTGLFMNVKGADADDFRGAIISNNLMDIGRQFFVGGIRDSSFTGNVAENCNSTVIAITAGGHRTTFNGNKLGGFENPSGTADVNMPGAAIWFNTGATVHGVDIGPNVLANIRNSAVRFSNDVSESSISGLVAQNYNTAANADDGAIRIDGNFVRSSITGGAFDENPAAGASPIQIGGSVDGSNIIGPASHGQVPLVSAGAVNPNSHVEEQTGLYSGRVGAIGDKDVFLEIRSRKDDATWVPDVDSFGGLEVNTGDSSGGGVGVAGALRLKAGSAVGSSSYWSVTSSTTNNRDAEAVRLHTGGVGVKSPDGTWWTISVDDTGTVTATS